MPPDTTDEPLLVALGLVAVMNGVAGVQLLHGGPTDVLVGVAVADVAAVAAVLALETGVLDDDSS